MTIFQCDESIDNCGMNNEKNYLFFLMMKQDFFDRCNHHSCNQKDETINEQTLLNLIE